MRVVVLGVTGMLGHAVFDVLHGDGRHEVWGTVRDSSRLRYLTGAQRERVTGGVDVLDDRALSAVLERVRPEMVINATGIIKQLETANDPLVVLPINAMFPHRLARTCASLGARMIQLSSDCVFSGKGGNYVESDTSDADDLYGKSKNIGEVLDQKHVITLRTSGIGHELGSRYGLLEWFLSQEGRTKGFKRAIYSGLPSVEVARMIRDYVFPHPELSGLYHVSAKPISKYDLLTLVARAYNKTITIEPDENVHIDRSLNSARFTNATGFVAAEWPTLVERMHEHQFSSTSVSHV